MNCLKFQAFFSEKKVYMFSKYVCLIRALKVNICLEDILLLVEYCFQCLLGRCFIAKVSCCLTEVMIVTFMSYMLMGMR